MNDQPDDPAARLRALAAAVAITTALSVQETGVTAADLLGDADPLHVVQVLSLALHSTLGLVLGEDGRSVLLQGLGLDAAQSGGAR